MTTKTASERAPRSKSGWSHLEQLPDPPRKHDMIHNRTVHEFMSPLAFHFADRDDVLVGGGAYLRQNASSPLEFYPDGMFADGVEDPEAIVARNGYVISEAGKPPDFVLEIASRSTGVKDYTVKREGYARYGVKEFWRFDSSGGRYHDAPLAGDTLVDGKYEPIAIVSESESRHWGYSPVLGLELWWYDEKLRFRDPVSGEFLPMPEESRAELEIERAARQDAEVARQSERTARQAAESRIAELEAELRRLRGQ